MYLLNKIITKFQTIPVRGMVIKIPCQKVYKDQIVIHDNAVRTVMFSDQKNKVCILDDDTEVKWDIIEKLVLIVNIRDEGWAIRQYDIKVSKSMYQSLYESGMGLFFGAILHTVDTINPKYRYSIDGTEKTELLGVGYYRYVEVLTTYESSILTDDSISLNILSCKVINDSEFDAHLNDKDVHLIVSYNKKKQKFFICATNIDKNLLESL